MAQPPVRIAGVQGFYGDSPIGALNIVTEGGADFLMQDALAELTLSILQKDRQRDPRLGYARDLAFLAKMVYPAAFQQGIRIVTNSGGLNPKAAAQKVAAIFAKQGLKGKKIAVITGDDMLPRLSELQQGGLALSHLDSGQPFSENKKPVTHANVYVGAAQVKAALDCGADLVLAGRIADPCLTLGIAAHYHGWPIPEDHRDAEAAALSDQDLNKLAGGIAAGHVIECGGQASGGNSYAEWPMAYKLSNLGYPIAEVHADGTAVFTKLASQGGRVSRNTLREQLVYEIHDPANYLTPDVTVDLSGIMLEATGKDEVRLTGVKGKPRPEQLKLAIGLREGYLSDQFYFFSWPYAYGKAQRFVEAVKAIWQNLPLAIERQQFDFIGVNGIHGQAAPLPEESLLEQLNEIGVRVAIQHADAKTGKLALAAITCLGLNGPPGINSMPGWGKLNRVQLSLFPTLLPREQVRLEVEMVEV